MSSKDVSDFENQVQFHHLPTEMELFRKDISEQFDDIKSQIQTLIRAVEERNSRRAKKIEEKAAEILKDNAQNPDDYRNIMKTACARSYGLTGIAIPWSQIQNRDDFRKWFHNTVRRYIVDDMVGEKLPSGLMNPAQDVAPPEVAHPATVHDFDD